MRLLSLVELSNHNKYSTQYSLQSLCRLHIPCSQIRCPEPSLTLYVSGRIYSDTFEEGKLPRTLSGHKTHSSEFSVLSLISRSASNINRPLMQHQSYSCKVQIEIFYSFVCSLMVKMVTCVWTCSEVHVAGSFKSPTPSGPDVRTYLLRHLHMNNL